MAGAAPLDGDGREQVGAFYMLAAIMAAASAVIVHAFVVGDYSIKYVQRVSDSAQPLFYKLTAGWGGLDGSIMFSTTAFASDLQASTASGTVN